MSRALRFTKAEISNAAIVAREQGVHVKLEMNGVAIHVFPDGHSATALDQPKTEEPSSYQKWKEKRDADKARRRAHG